MSLDNDTERLTRLLAEAKADEAAIRMHEDLKELLMAAVDALLVTHPVLLSSWSSQGFELSRSEFAGLWMTDLALSAKLTIEQNERGAA
jgi:hypothetical protein